MEQTLPVYVINLDRRPDRLTRIGEHLSARGISFIRHSACDAEIVSEAEIDEIIRRHGPLGQMGRGDRACTASHVQAWTAFLQTDASHALFLEDDIHLAQDAATLLQDPGWIPEGPEAIKLEKFNEGTSKILLRTPIGQTPSGRSLRPMASRHVGGGAYILSRKGAELALSHRGRYRVPIDHFLFNDTVSPIRRALKPAMIVPPMATQRAQGYNSDIAASGKAIAPRGLRKRWRNLRRGLTEVNQLHRQLWEYGTGRAKIVPVKYQDQPD